jgi:ElaB/YqjD/DUF883 family membrane-anchored ribosome-binding protein
VRRDARFDEGMRVAPRLDISTEETDMSGDMATSFEDRVSALKQSMRDIVDYGSGRAGVFKEKLGDAKDSAIAGAHTAIDKTGRMIKRHPFLAIGIALGLGFVVMRMVTRRR